MGAQQKVYIIQDSPESFQKSHAMISEITKRFHDVVELNLEAAIDRGFSDAVMIIVDVAPSDYDTVTTLKYILKDPRDEEIPILFLLSAMNRRQIIQAQQLGATKFLVHPVKRKEFTTTLRDIANNSIENSWENLSQTQSAALKVSLKVFEDTFDNINSGQPISNAAISESCDLIIQATAEKGLSDMLAAIRTHHNYTYRHSMMVCGYLTSFSMLLGIQGEDLQHLTIAGLLHDVGKAHVPPELLDKPGPLTDEEWVVMRTHPEHSRQILLDSDVHDDIKDGAVHHHEKIDGTGYPDGLSGTQISDFARMVAIADVFSGLTEKRAYKTSMSNQKAYDIMCEMVGHLDQDLVRVFKPIALEMD